MKKSIITSAILAAGVLALGVTANASTVTGSVAVSATVIANCTIGTNPLAFGNYTGAVNNATSNLTVTCTNTTPYDVTLDKGLNGGTTATRQMKSGTSLLNYSISKDAANTLNWGSVIGTDASHGVGSGAVQTLILYGQIPAAQFVTPGAYTDTVTATLTY